MENKILTINKAIKLATDMRKKGKTIVLAGGCFDILHIGHITFIEKTKAEGDIFFVLLEADKRIQLIKGRNRPINKQRDRAKVLSALESVDYVILLPQALTDKNYENMIINLKPDIITTTIGDPGKAKKERQAKLVGAKVVEVTEYIKDQSTSRLIELLECKL